MKTGIGYANLKNSYQAGVSVAQQALENGHISNPNVVFAFCSSSVDHSAFYNGLRTRINSDVAIIGGSAVGILTNTILSYEGYPSGALILESDTVTFDVNFSDNLDISIYTAGKSLAQKFSRRQDDKIFLLFYDSIKQPGTPLKPPVINSSAPLITAIEETLGDDLPIIGSGLIGDNNFSQTIQYTGNTINSQSAIGCLVSGSCVTYTRIMHGCTPLDGTYHTITKMHDDIIYEIDNKPIVPCIDDIYGHTKWRQEHPLQLLSLGVNYGERYEQPIEGHYVNRLITGALPDGSGIGLFEADLETGIDVQFMLRDTSEMITSAQNNATELLRHIQLDGATPWLGLYIDCGGRCAAISNTSIEEASEVQKVFNGAGVPLFGFYSGVEIAPLLGNNRGLDYTGVLTVLAGR